jgi:transposase
VDGRHEQRQVFCGIDWAERHHDVALVDINGALLAKQRISDDVQGFAQLLALLAEHGATPGPEGTPVAIETAAGLLPAAVVASGYRLFPINPLAVSRYRDRYGAAKTKSDAGDAFVLANIARTDLPAHRPLPADSELVQAVRVLARAHADAVGDRQQAQNKLRSLLREYYPAALATLPDLSTITARTTLRLAPTPQAARSLAPDQLRAALVQAGRHTRLDAEVPRIVAGLRAEQLRQLRQVEHAMGEQALALLGLLDAACAAVSSLEKALTTAFANHQDAPILLSQPGLGTVLAARLLAELGDDRTRFASARGLRAFAGTAPITRASGTMRGVFARRVRNRRLAQVSYQWAFSLLTASPGARAHYDQRRARRDGHSAAGRRLASHT